MICTNALSFLVFAILMRDATSDNFFTLLWSTIYPLAMALILYNLLKIRRKALYQFGIIQFANAVLNTLLIEKPLGEALLISVGICLIFAAMLCLRKNGVSAWNLLLKEEALEEEQNLSIEIKESAIEETADDSMLQNCEIKDSISKDEVKEHIEENIIQNEPESKGPELTFIDDKVEDTSLTDLPYKEDGSIDFENMTATQQFAYTSITESVEIALIDLEADIKAYERSIEKIKYEISSSQTVNRAMLRDSLRKEQGKLDELYKLRSKHSVKKKAPRKYIPIIIGGIILLLFLIPFVVSIKTNLTPDFESRNDIVKTNTVEGNTIIESYETEEERWDAENCVYANFKYGIAFNLTRGISWKRVSGTAKHTIVKFLQPDSGLTMYANIYPLGADVPSDDIWDIYSEFIKIYKEEVLPYGSSNNGIEVENFKHRKADICGKNAIKIEYNFIIDDERYDGEQFTSVDYAFLYKGSMVSVGATCINEWVDNFLEDDFTLEDFLSSFHLTPTNNNNINN